MDLVPPEKPPRRKPVRSKPAFRKAPENFAQGELIGRTMDDMVAPDDPVRAVKHLIKLVRLDAFEERLQVLGGVDYDPRVMLILWMFSLWDGERSARKIEKSCRHDVRYIFLLDGLTPDHVTISRFRKSLGKTLLRRLILQTVDLGKEQGLTTLGTASLDGTKLPSASSQWRKYLDEAESADSSSEEPKAEEPSPMLSEEQEADPSDSASEAAAPALASGPADPPKTNKPRKEKKPSTDPEARVMRLTKGGFAYGYNGQALVDSEAGMILSTHVTNCASDSGELTQAMQECLEVHGDLPDKIAADAGYDTPANAEAMAECGVEGWISSKDKDFVWIPSEDGKPVCPAGLEASNRETFKKNGTLVVRMSVQACPNCERRETCKAGKSKTISFPAGVDISHHLRQRERAKSDEAKPMRALRASTSELAFAHMKGIFGLERLHLRGLVGAEIEFGMAALARNYMILVRRLGKEGIEALIMLFSGAFLVIFGRFLAPVGALWQYVGDWGDLVKRPSFGDRLCI